MATPNTPSHGSPPSKRVRIDFGEEVIVLVGKSEKRFFCHPTILRAHSPFFEAALSGKWLESEEKLVRLPEQDPSAFSIYLNWRYTGVIDLWDGKEKTGTYINFSEQIKEEQGDRYYRLVRCTALADMLQDHAFGNALIDSYFDLVRITNQFPASAALNSAFRLLAEASWVRRVFIRQLAFSADHDAFSQRIDGYDREVVEAIALLSISERNLAMKDKIPNAKRQSFYHIPSKGANERS